MAHGDPDEKLLKGANNIAATARTRARFLFEIPSCLSAVLVDIIGLMNIDLNGGYLRICAVATQRIDEQGNCRP